MLISTLTAEAFTRIDVHQDLAAARSFGRILANKFDAAALDQIGDEAGNGCLIEASDTGKFDTGDRSVAIYKPQYRRDVLVSQRAVVTRCDIGRGCSFTSTLTLRTQ